LQHVIRRPEFRSIFYLVVASIALSLAGSACGFLGDDEDAPDASGVTGASAGTSGTADGVSATTSYRVVQARMGREVDVEKRISDTPARAFPAGTTRVYAEIVLEGVRPGDEVVGRWFQLSVRDVSPAGNLVTEAGVTLAETDFSPDGLSQVTLDLGTGTGMLPEGDWVVRIYVNGEFVRTMGFVITPLLTEGAAQQPPQASARPQQPPAPTPGQQAPAPTATQTSAPPAPTATPTQQGTPETYTVVAGDTLTIIAERFKPATESTESYVARLQEVNNLAPGAILTVGQVLTLPAP
jgi:LysM repeat protein